GGGVIYFDFGPLPTQRKMLLINDNLYLDVDPNDCKNFKKINLDISIKQVNCNLLINEKTKNAEVGFYMWIDININGVS
ncbi:MAG: hypothetical protein QXF15_01635, partial [Candidatus Aenigmatarchaeota archaeon]